MKFNKISIIAIALTLFLTACSNETKTPNEEPGAATSSEVTEAPVTETPADASPSAVPTIL